MRKMYQKCDSSATVRYTDEVETHLYDSVDVFLNFFERKGIIHVLRPNATIAGTVTCDYSIRFTHRIAENVAIVVNNTYSG